MGDALYLASKLVLACDAVTCVPFSCCPQPGAVASDVMPLCSGTGVAYSKELSKGVRGPAARDAKRLYLIQPEFGCRSVGRTGSKRDASVGKQGRRNTLCLLPRLRAVRLEREGRACGASQLRHNRQALLSVGGKLDRLFACAWAAFGPGTKRLVKRGVLCC